MEAMGLVEVELPWRGVEIHQNCTVGRVYNSFGPQKQVSDITVRKFHWSLSPTF